MPKYFKILIPLLLFYAGVFGQGKPINVYRSAPSVTVNDAYLHAYKGFTLPIVPDTASGINGSLDSLGQLIYVKANGKIYQRDSVPTGGHVWTPVGTGSGGGSDSGIVAGVAVIVNRIDANHRVIGVDTLHVVASQWLAQHKIDSLAAALNALLNAKVTNFANASFLGYGLYAAKPTSGSGFFFVQDSARLAYITSGVLAWITDPPGKIFHIYIKRKGQPGDSTLLTGTDSTFFVAAIRDSLGWHHVVNADGSWTCWSTGGGITAADTANISFRLDTANQLATTSRPGRISAADFTKLHTPIYPINDSVGGAVDSVTYFDNVTNQWHFKGLYFRYGHKPTSTLLVNYDDIDTLNATGLAPRHDLDDSSRVLQQGIATKMTNFGGAPGQLQGPNASLPSATSYLTGTTYIAQDSGFQYVDTGSGGTRGWKKLAAGNVSSGTTISPSNPTATMGYAIQNGVATTYMRSDASPALDSNGQHPAAVTTQASRNALKDSLLRTINAVYPNESQVGDIFNAQTFQNSLTSFGSPNSSGSATVTLSSGYPVITTTSSASWFSTITQLPDRPTMLPLWSDTLEFQLLFTPSSGTTGMGPALISNEATSPLSLKGYLNTTNSSNGNIVLATHAGVVLGSGGTGCTNTLNDVIRTVLTKVNDSTFTFQAFNLTTGATSTVATATFVTTLGGNLPPNIGNWGYVAFGTGTYRILRRHIVSTAKRYPYVANAMNSKGVSVGASKFGLGIGATLGRSFVSTVNYSGAGSTAADFLKLKTEMLMLDPAYVTFGYYSNDLRFGATLAQTESLIITAASWWKGTSTKFIVTAIPEDSLAGGIGMTNLKNWMANPVNQANYGFIYVDSWTTLTGGSGNRCIAPYIAADGIHLLDAGYAVEAGLLSAAIGANPIRRASPRTYSPTLVPIGDSLTTTYSVTNRIGYIPVADSNLNVVPSFFQQNGSQAGVSANGSYIPAFGSTFGVNGQIGTNGTSGGFSFYDRSTNPTFGSAYGIYCDKNLLRFFTNALTGRDFNLMDSAGRIKFGNFTAGIQTVRPLGLVDIIPSDGATGHPSLVIEPGTKITTAIAGGIENDSTDDDLEWTAKAGTRYRIAHKNRAQLFSAIQGYSTNFGSTYTSRTFTDKGYVDSAIAASAGASAPFADNVAIIKNNSDPTKLFKISASGIATGQTRTMTVPDYDFAPATLAHAQTFTGFNTFTASNFYVNSGDIELNGGSSVGSVFISPVDVSINGAVDYSSLSFTASFTINTTSASYSASFVTCGTLSGAGVITLPSSGAGGRTYKLVNANNTANAWTFAGATLKDGFGNTITAFPNGYTYEIYFNGSTWDLKNVSYSGIAKNGIAASGSVSTTGTATTTFTVTIGVTEPVSTYKVNVTPTDVLSAALFYVTNKTATTFDVVYLSGLTGTVSFDWTVTP